MFKWLAAGVFAAYAAAGIVIARTTFGWRQDARRSARPDPAR